MSIPPPQAPVRNGTVGTVMASKGRRVPLPAIPFLPAPRG